MKRLIQPPAVTSARPSADPRSVLGAPVHGFPIAWIGTPTPMGTAGRPDCKPHRGCRDDEQGEPMLSIQADDARAVALQGDWARGVRGTAELN